MAKESRAELEAVAATHRKVHQDAEGRLYAIRARRVDEFIADGGTLERHEQDLVEAEAAVADARRVLSSAEAKVTKAKLGELRSERAQEIQTVLKSLDEAEAAAERMADAQAEAHKHGQAFFVARRKAANAFKAIGASGFDRIHRVNCALSENWHLEGLRADLETKGGLGSGTAFRERVRAVHASLRTPTEALLNGEG